MLQAIASLTLPDEAVRLAREELRRRLRKPGTGTADRERARLLVRLERLKALFAWGDIDEADYRRDKADVEARLAALPDRDKLVLFDRQREVLLSMAENLQRATPAQVQELLAKLVERIEITDGRVTRIVWVPAARPFFAASGYSRPVTEGDASDSAVALVGGEGLEPPTFSV